MKFYTHPWYVNRLSNPDKLDMFGIAVRLRN